MTIEPYEGKVSRAIVRLCSTHWQWNRYARVVSEHTAHNSHDGTIQHSTDLATTQHCIDHTRSKPQLGGYWLIWAALWLAWALCSSGCNSFRFSKATTSGVRCNAPAFDWCGTTSWTVAWRAVGSAVSTYGQVWYSFLRTKDVRSRDGIISKCCFDPWKQP